MYDFPFGIAQDFAFDANFLGSNTSIAAAGFYVDDVGWQQLFWQDCLVAPLLAQFVFLGAPREPIERDWPVKPSESQRFRQPQRFSSLPINSGSINELSEVSLKLPERTT